MTYQGLEAIITNDSFSEVNLFNHHHFSQMAQLASNLIQDTFGEVNAWKMQDGTVRVKAYVLMRPILEHAQTGIAINGSSSMADIYGGPRTVSDLFGGINSPNCVEPVARKMASFLAGFDREGKTSAIYFGLGKKDAPRGGCEGAEVQEIGELDRRAAETYSFTLPANAGQSACLAPAIRYFLNHFNPHGWLICLFLTNGKIDDLEEVKALSKNICREMSEGKRGYTKFVLLGLGRELSLPGSPAALAFSELDDLNSSSGPDIPSQDLWDLKLAADMRKEEEIFAEAASERIILCKGAEIIDSNGLPVKPVSGIPFHEELPSIMDFTMSPGATAFTLRLPNGRQVTQNISSAL